MVVVRGRRSVVKCSGVGWGQQSVKGSLCLTIFVLLVGFSRTDVGAGWGMTHWNVEARECRSEG